MGNGHNGHKSRLWFDMKPAEAVQALSGDDEASAIALEKMFYGRGYPFDVMRWEDIAKAVDRLQLYDDKVGILLAIHGTPENTAKAIYNAYRAANSNSRMLPERQIEEWRKQNMRAVRGRVISLPVRPPRPKGRKPTKKLDK